jgi:ribosomal protein L23
MSLITPNSTFKLLHGVPLDFNHRNVRYFGSRSEQLSFFEAFSKYSFPSCTYVRQEGKIRVDKKADDLYDCNYLMYQNTSYGSKWFYAFITDVEYVNDSTTYISFILDDFQNWLYNIDYTIKPSFVEREHVTDDSIGAHIIDEGLALNDFITTSRSEYIFNDWWICIGSAVELKAGENYLRYAGGYTYGGIYSAINWYCFEMATALALLPAIFEGLASTNKMDAIVSMFMIPKDIVGIAQSDGGYLQADIRVPVGLTVPNTKTLDGYYPRNKKLLTYPYRSLLLSNNEGNTSALRYEFFTGGNDYADLEFVGGIQPNSRIIAYPISYKGVTRNVQEGVSLGNFPQCAWLSNVYAQWLGQMERRWGYQEGRMTRNYIANLLSGGIVGGAVGEATGSKNVGVNVAGGVAKSGVSGIMNQLDFYSKMAEEKEIHSMEPPAVKGTIGNGYTNISIGKYGFQLEERTIKQEIAKSIDGYFDMFGYKVNSIKVPNLNTRPHWNYVKTTGITIIGNVPADALVNITNVFNNGVTFWKNTDEIGNYSLNNSI